MSKKRDTVSDFETATGFEEWYCSIKVGEDKKPIYEKLKKKRDNVQITEEQADVLNTGRLNGGNSHALLYFKPDAE